ncbi:uncharacterized protein [Lolium perenne]|uniref:uncharacterized protein isoform X1 n=1 Tax=Lolium perenne TaxID=4522 RepID=UPI0021F69544|nr:uncharacterized protein LOC127313191 isoform X1 [Lolium perenne]
MLDPNPQKKPGLPMMAAILVPGDIAAASGNAIQTLWSSMAMDMLMWPLARALPWASFCSSSTNTTGSPLIARTGGRIAGSLERSLGLIQEGGNSRDCQFFLHVFGRLMTEKWVSFNEKVDEATFHCIKKREGTRVPGTISTRSSKDIPLQKAES